MANNNDNVFMLKGILCILIVVVIILFSMLNDKGEKKPVQKSIQKQEHAEPVKKEETKQAIEQETPAEIKQEDLSSYIFSPNLPPFTKYKYSYVYTFTVNGYIPRLIFELPIPDNEKGKQYISDFNISPEPKIIEKSDGSLFAKFEIKNLSTGKFKIIISGIANVRTYNINTAKKLNKNISPETDLKRYLLPEKYIESDDKYIIGVANGIQADSQEELIEKVYKYIQDHMTYRIEKDVKSAKQALLNRYGKCSEYSAIMTAILRAKGIPARVVTGNIARDGDTAHNWVEVYFNDYGWVSYDPTTAPTQVSVFGANGKLQRVEKRYDVSHDDIQYIQSGLNLFSPYQMHYIISSQKGGTVKLNSYILISKAE